jgi:hypothetical protein
MRPGNVGLLTLNPPSSRSTNFTFTTVVRSDTVVLRSLNQNTCTQGLNGHLKHLNDRMLKYPFGNVSTLGTFL